MNLSFINSKLQSAKISFDVFGILGGDIDSQLNGLKILFNLMAKSTHPDRYETSSDKKVAHEAFICLNTWYETAIQDVKNKTYGQKPLAKIKSKKHTYIVKKDFHVGNIANLFDISNEKTPDVNLVLKIASDKANNDLINNEIRVLKRLASETGKGMNLINHHINLPLEVFEADNKQSIVFPKLNNFYSLAEIRNIYPHGIDAKTVAWIFRRILAILAVIHDLNYIHGGIILSNFMICPETHNGKLIDFTGAIEKGGKAKIVIPEYQDFYPLEIWEKREVSPATDIFMAAKCMMTLLGSQDAPKPFRDFFKSCLIHNPHKRPNKSLDLFHDFSNTIDSLWERKFHEFTVKQ